MTTQYTPILKLALPVEGELDGTWGDVVNDNITSMVEQAIAGAATINTWTANVHTLTTADGTTSEARCAMLIVQTGTGGTALTAAGQVVCPTATKLYVLRNESAYAVTLKTAAGSGIAVAAGNAAFLLCDGTNVTACVTTVGGVMPVVNGGTGQTTYTNGQLLIGNTTGNTLTKATLTAGTGISITNGTGSISIAATNNGTVTSVGGTGTVNGITLTGTVTSTGNLTLGGTLSNVNLASQVTGTLPIANGGTGSTSTTYCNLTTNVANTLPIANGGTGATTAANAFTALKQAATDTATGVVELATNAEAAAGSDTTRAITPATLFGGLNASGATPIYAARAWVNFDGTLTSPIAPRASGNVSSVTKSAAGTYAVNFATSAPDANYAVIATCSNDGSGSNIPGSVSTNTGQTTSAVTLLIRDSSSGSVDRTLVYAAIFR